MGVAADHTAALLPAALALDPVGGRAVLGHAPCHAHPLAVAAEVLPIGKTCRLGNSLHPWRSGVPRRYSMSDTRPDTAGKGEPKAAR